MSSDEVEAGRVRTFMSTDGLDTTHMEDIAINGGRLYYFPA